MAVCYSLFLSSIVFSQGISIIPGVGKGTEQYEQESLHSHIETFCKGKGRAYFKINNGIEVDCMTSGNLWRFVHAENWQAGVLEALEYAIYDTYHGDPDLAPIPGLVLVEQSYKDYQYFTKARTIAKYYNLPLKIESIKYSPSYKRKNTLKKFVIY